MTVRPTDIPSWSTTTLATGGVEVGLSTRLDPGSGFKAEGFHANRRMPARWFNYLIGLLGDWTQYLDQKHRHVYNILNYGADPTGVADASTAYGLAVADVLAGGGGELLLPGVFKFNSGLSFPKGLSLRGIPGYTILSLNHATANFLTAAAGIYSGHPQRISGIAFEGTVTNTGKVIYDAGAQVRGLIVENCSSNYSAANLQGDFFRCDGNVGSSFLLDNVNARLAGSGGFVTHANGGDLVIRGGKVAVPATSFTVDAVSIGNLVRARISGTRFDMTLGTSGGGSMINPGSSSGSVALDNCVFEDGASAIDPIVVAGALMHTSSLQFINCINYHYISIAAAGSSLELRPYGAATTVAASYTIPNGYRSFLLRSNTSTAVRFPNGLFAGQEFEFSYYNNAATAVVPTLTFTPVTGGGGAIPTCTNGRIISGIFVWEDRDGSGSYRWVQKGAWCIDGTTIV